MNNKQRDTAGILGRQVIGGIKDMEDFISGMSSRLGFIVDGLLMADRPDVEGAAGLLADMDDRLQEKREDVETLWGRAKTLQETAGGVCPILPNTTTEVELFEVIRAAQNSLACKFICEAGLAAARIYKERFALPERFSGPEDEAEAIRAAMSACLASVDDVAKA